jgi:hypothetical protein
MCKPPYHGATEQTGDGSFLGRWVPRESRRRSASVYRRHCGRCRSRRARVHRRSGQDDRAGLRPFSSVRFRAPRSSRTSAAASDQSRHDAVAARSVGARPHVLRSHVSRSRGNRPRTAHASLGLTTAPAALAAFAGVPAMGRAGIEPATLGLKVLTRRLHVNAAGRKCLQVGRGSVAAECNELQAAETKRYSNRYSISCQVGRRSTGRP